MLDHPFSIFGWLVAGAGFALLIFWVPTGVPSPGFGVRVEPVFNMHKAQISWAVLLMGLAMVISGAVAGGFKSLHSRQVGVPEPVPEGRQTPAELLPDGDLSATTWIVTVKDRQGMDRQLNVSNDGSVVVDTTTGKKSFHSVDQAKAYLA